MRLYTERTQTGRTRSCRREGEDPLLSPLSAPSLGERGRRCLDRVAKHVNHNLYMNIIYIEPSALQGRQTITIPSTDYEPLKKTTHNRAARVATTTTRSTSRSCSLITDQLASCAWYLYILYEDFLANRLIQIQITVQTTRQWHQHRLHSKLPQA